ncbi:MAG: radical SAM protein [Clostridia bacterium]|nr:radical SAM protein [Clostridia bacterium]
MSDKELVCTRREGMRLGDLTVAPYHRFTLGDRCMLINRETGSTLFLTAFAADALERGEPDSRLRYQLVVNGFASVPGAPALQCHVDTVMPTFFLIDMTNRCNLGCAYCLRVPTHLGKAISKERLQDVCGYILAHCRAHQLDRITIQPWGGEPLLELDRVLEIRRFFDQEPGIQVEITVETNGTLLTPEILTQLREHRISISVSLDGTPDVHDLQRRDRGGRPTSDRVREGILAARAAGYRDLGGICVLTDHSIGRVQEILDYCEHELGMGGVKLNLMRQPAYPCEGVRALDDEEIQAMSAEIVEAVETLIARGSRLKESGVLDRLHNLLSRSESNICHSCGCCGGLRMVSFDMDGLIYPCELTDWADECLGSIYSGADLCDMVRAAIPKKAYFRQKHKTECDDCPWWYYCRGGCSSAVKYLSQQGTAAVDECECTLNRSMYPLLAALLLRRGAELKGWMS